ncbi:MAG: hypothetical protein IIY21_02885 [Clostridiales bacterium]|nr:hypothetical protein [Clostridiales bacterium]
MSYTAYVTSCEYAEMGYSSIAPDKMDAYLRRASRDVDALTFNRIVAKGFDNLTDFQKEIIKEVVCEQANFLYENSDAISSILDSYAINGVSMKFGSGFNVIIEGGLPIQSTVYSLLKQTGLCWRGAR